MNGDYGLGDFRHSGMSNSQLATEVEQLRAGPGPSSMHDAMDALIDLADGLAEMDGTLRDQLQKIGVVWTGESADGGTAATQDAAIYADDSRGPVGDSADGVGNSGDTYSDTKNKAPDPSVLNGPTEESGLDQALGRFGYTTDNAQKVEETRAGREQAIDALDGYANQAGGAVSSAQALPVPPTLTLDQTGSAPSSTTAAAGFVFGPDSQFTGPGAGSGGAPNVAPGAGGGGTPNPAAPPGELTGAKPLGPTPGLPTGPGGAQFRPPVGPNPLLMSDAAAMMGAGTAAGVGSGAEQERTARGGRGATATPPKDAKPLGSAPAEEARAARNAERFGAKAGKPGSSMMQPAAAGQRAEGEEDTEHVRRYGVESGDVFDDERVVAPESIGNDEDDD
jgi:hypothetical protein